MVLDLVMESVNGCYPSPWQPGYDRWRFPEQTLPQTAPLDDPPQPGLCYILIYA